MSLLVHKTAFSISITSDECELDGNKWFIYKLQCPLDLKHCKISLLYIYNGSCVIFKGDKWALACRQIVLPIPKFLKKRIVGDACRLYTDITDPAMDGKEACLCTTPYATSQAQMLVSHESSNPSYFPLAISKIDKIGLQLRNSRSQIIQYQAVSPPWLLTLHFKMVI